jgi:O-antigen/teichoic acid export membrane protein
LEGVGLVKPTRDTNEWFKGALILTIAALITKILSAAYRVPFQNIVGDIGFYIYQQVYPFYGLALVLSTYGFPVIISKHFSELKVKNQPEKAYRFLAFSFLTLSILGILSFLGLYYGASWLAHQMDDPSLALLLKVISVVFLIFPIISVLRGYFQGMGNMVPTATSQVGEQLIRVITILTVAILFTKEGLSLYVVGSGAAFGSITGGLIAIIILVIFFLRETKDSNSWINIRNRQLFSELGLVLKLLLIQGFAVCISSMVLIFVQLADSLNMLSLLIGTGMDSDSAKVLKGVYDRGQPLLQLGTIVATSLSLSLVPIISSERLKANKEDLHSKIRTAMTLSFVIGVGATVGLVAIIGPTNEMLYENQEGSAVLATLTPIILICSLSLTVISILQGLGMMFFPAIVIIFTFLLKYGLNIIFISKFGSIGAAIATNISLGFGLLLLWWKLSKFLKKPIVSSLFLFKLIVASIIMFIVLKVSLSATYSVFQSILSERLVATIQSISGVFFGGILFLLVIMRSKLLRVEDLALLPFGSKLLYLLPPKERRRINYAEKN